MQFVKQVSLISAVMTSILSPVMAGVEITGSVNPNDPSTWSSSANLNIGDAFNSPGSVTIYGDDETFSTTTLNVGLNSKGSLIVRDGATLNSVVTYIGTYASSEVLISNGTWINTSSLTVASGVASKIKIEKNGKYTSKGNISAGQFQNASIVVTGGSSFELTGASIASGFTLGSTYQSLVRAAGTLTITNNATVTVAGTVTVNGAVSHPTYTGTNGTAPSKIVIDAGGGSTLAVNNFTRSNGTVTNGTITNNGIIRLFASTHANAGTYNPLSATVYGGTTGVYQGVGGVWNASEKTFVVYDALTASAGQTASVDLALNQRVIYTNTAGKTAGISLLASTSTVNVAADVISDVAALALLNSTADSVTSSDVDVLSAWTFSSADLASNSPSVLTFELGDVASADGLIVWQYDGSAWTQYTTDDFVYNDGYAYFGITGLGSYAITGVAVPEPTTIGLMGLASLGLLIRKRKA